jgi:hypothetical protein
MPIGEKGGGEARLAAEGTGKNSLHSRLDESELEVSSSSEFAAPLQCLSTSQLTERGVGQEGGDHGKLSSLTLLFKNPQV